MSLTIGDEDAIRRVLDDYLESWNRCDAKACAELYDRTGDLLAVDGTLLRSHAQIKQYYDDNLSGKYGGFRLEASRYSEFVKWVQRWRCWTLSGRCMRLLPATLHRNLLRSRLGALFWSRAMTRGKFLPLGSWFRSR